MAKNNIVDWKTITNFVIDSFVGYGIPREDVFIDCLTMTASTEQAAAMVTVNTVHKVKKELEP